MTKIKIKENGPHYLIGQIGTVIGRRVARGPHVPAEYQGLVELKVLVAAINQTIEKTIWLTEDTLEEVKN
jgi:hypothetical protein